MSPKMIAKAQAWFRGHRLVAWIIVLLLAGLVEIGTNIELSGRAGTIQGTIGIAVMAFLIVYQFRKGRVAFRSGWKAKQESPVTYWLVLGGESLALAAGIWATIPDLHLKL